MKAIAFDTLEFAKTLKDANFSNEQAEALARAMSWVVEERLSTKQDLKESEAALRRDLKESEATLKRDLKESEASLRRDLKELEASLRHDIKELEASLRHDIKELELATQRDLKDLEYRLTVRLGGMLAAAVAIVAALVKLL